MILGNPHTATGGQNNMRIVKTTFQSPANSTREQANKKQEKQQSGREREREREALIAIANVYKSEQEQEHKFVSVTPAWLNASAYSQIPSCCHAALS